MAAFGSPMTPYTSDSLSAYRVSGVYEYVAAARRSASWLPGSCAAVKTRGACLTPFVVGGEQRRRNMKS